MLMSYQYGAVVPATYQRGTVACVKCTREVALRNLTSLAEEFTLRCPHCHHRAFYSKRVLNVDNAPERRTRRR